MFNLLLNKLISNTDKADLGKDEETDIESILDKELAPLMVDNLDPEERLLAEGISDRGFRSKYVQPRPYRLQ